jgi:hypothetical protein
MKKDILSFPRFLAASKLFPVPVEKSLSKISLSNSPSSFNTNCNLATLIFPFSFIYPPAPGSTRL